MRVIIDPVYTNSINRCASAVKMRTCVEHILNQTTDVFFYWFIPSGLTEEEREWLPKDSRIGYFELTYFEDRYKEYWHASDEYRRKISFSGALWDADIILTNRTTLVPFIRWAMQGASTIMNWGKFIVLIEDMPLMSFKMFVLKVCPREADIASLSSYLTAYRTLLSSFWEKKHMISTGKNYLSPASLRYLDNTIIEATHKIQTPPILKTPEAIARTVSREKKFTISYAGRMVNRDFVDDSFEVLLNTWILGGNDVRVILCTVSKNYGRIKHELTNIIEWMRPNREEFWRIMREDADVGVFMSRDEDYSMAMLEPLMQGTPLVIFRAEHAVASIGADYPFFISNTNEGLAIIRMFQQDYSGMYAKFSEWSKTCFTPLLAERNKSYIPNHVMTVLEEWREAQKKARTQYNRNEIVQLIAKHAPETGPFDMIEVLKEQEKKKNLRNPISWKAEEQFDDLRLGFGTHFDMYRMGMFMSGFKDAGPRPGWMERV